MPPSTFPFAPPFFALAAKAVLGHIGAGIVHGKTKMCWKPVGQEQ